jgi:hypothetical protein
MKTAKKFKVNARLRRKGLEQADHRAKCRCVDGVGTGAEAVAEWEQFKRDFPSLAPHADFIEWCRRYRSAPHWEAIQRHEGIPSLEWRLANLKRRAAERQTA